MRHKQVWLLSALLLTLTAKTNNTANAQENKASSVQTYTGVTFQKKDAFDRGENIKTEKFQIAGLDVAVWRPIGAAKPLPLIIFSHGFTGINTQSKFLTKAIAAAGYVVVAPNHQDKGGFGTRRPQIPFRLARQWSDSTYKDRDDDVVRLIDALRQDREWKGQINWTRIAVSGHSLGGYTALGVSGAWPSWKLKDVKACLAISPYCEPYIQADTLRGVGVPILYLGGTTDRGITPTLIRNDGAYAKTSSPVILVEFKDVGHMSFTDFNRNEDQQDLINYYCISFLNKYVKGNSSVEPTRLFTGVVKLDSK